MTCFKTNTRTNCVAPKSIELAASNGNLSLSNPSYAIAMDAMKQYERWVSCMLMPIAFQWVWEHHDEVYREIDPALRDDIGEVTRQAFRLVRGLEAYRASAVEYEELEAGKEFDPALINPIWTRTLKTLREDLERTFEADSRLLDETRCATLAGLAK